MNKLKLLREERALTQSEVAEAVRITTSYYGMLESGRRIPSLPIAIRLAKHFNLSVEKIFNY
ncbi:helix-turn-helix transcriptional regulator [Clostridium culturomicium]|uniref:helix-turn-helix transcriptional regulator n=1 Tax=Clostridium culturomicium TaxID=1499683 RepID=UPI0038578EC0